MKAEERQGPALRISEIAVEGLFGRYSYNIATPTDDSLAILYGDNGSGKTTILRTMFHMLSTTPDRGHKTAIAQTPFRIFELRFVDGTTLRAERDGNAFAGDFRLSLSTPGSGSWSADYATIDAGEGGIMPRSGATPSQHAFEIVHQGHFQELDAFLLGDSRQLQTDSSGDKHTDRELAHRRRVEYREMGQTIIPVAASLTKAGRWLRNQALEGTSEGDVSFHALFRDIADKVSKGEATMAPDLPRLTEQLLQLETRNADFTRFGLMEPMKAAELVGKYQGAPAKVRVLLGNILSSYAESVSVRMKALSETQRLFALVEDTINSFLVDKSVRANFRSREVLEVRTNSGDLLDPESLSSGEKHLLVLICNTLASRTRPSIFLIDEPELSLNVKWQRLLVDALLRLTEGTDNQFFFATHSIELLTKHRKSVLRLGKSVSRIRDFEPSPGES